LTVWNALPAPGAALLIKSKRPNTSIEAKSGFAKNTRLGEAPSVVGEARGGGITTSPTWTAIAKQKATTTENQKNCPAAKDRAGPKENLAMTDIPFPAGKYKQTAVILKFPPRGRFANAVRVERERGTDGWLTLADAFGWAHGDFASALREAHEIAGSNGLAVVSSAGRRVPC